jgi:predicted ribosomally synthesized peptide with SipW-like signal peptide
MRTKTKALALALCAVLLVVTTVFVTMAFLTSKDSVKNTFTVGKVTITLDEAKVTADGEKVQGADRVKENKYHLIPGHFYVKDPTIHVANGSEECWLFVKVENGLANAEASGATSIESQMANKGWTKVEGTDVYAYATKQAAGANVIVFDSFTIAGTTDVSLYEDAKIIVTAYAIQADGFATATEAWTIAGGEAQNK